MRHRTAAVAMTVLLAATTFLVTNAAPASACSCAMPTPASDAVDANEWVFIGRQIDRILIGGGSSVDGRG